MEGAESQQPELNMSAFEDEEEELDPAQPYHPIIQELDLPLGTAALHLAFPRLLRSSQITSDLSPRILQENIVVAVACADATTKLLTIPMLPPSPEGMERLSSRKKLSLGSTKSGIFVKQIITIPSASGHQSLPKAICVDFMQRSMSEAGGADSEDIDAMDEDTQENKEDLWDIIVATCGSDPLADFAIYKLPLGPEGGQIHNVEDPSPNSTSRNSLWRTQSLTNPAVAMDIHVPANPRTRQGPYLLLAELNGAFRVFDCHASSESNSGRWIRSFHLGFEATSDGSVSPRTILDAKFVLGGQAIAVLTADGEWGVWNLSLQKLGKLDGIENNSLSGVIPTKFNINGWMGGSSSSTTVAKSSSGGSEQRSSLAPMTPGTRKVRQEALFSGTNSAPTRSPFGGIFVQPTGTALGGRDADDTLIIWHGDKSIIIPSLSAHWQNKIKGSGSLFGDANGRIRELKTGEMYGELRNAISLFPEEDSAGRATKGFKQPDVLVSSDHGFTILSTPLKEEGEEVRERPRSPPTATDHSLLAQRSLDVDGMGRILEGMTNGARQLGAQLGAAGKRRVGFAS
jgi:hypothetical protein